MEHSRLQCSRKGILTEKRVWQWVEAKAWRKMAKFLRSGCMPLLRDGQVPLKIGFLVSMVVCVALKMKRTGIMGSGLLVGRTCFRCLRNAEWPRTRLEMERQAGGV